MVYQLKAEGFITFSCFERLGFFSSGLKDVLAGAFPKVSKKLTDSVILRL